MERETTTASGRPRSRAGADLLRAKQLLDAHVDNSPLAVIEFDPEFRVIRWAASAERMFGYSAEEVVGRSITDMRWVYEEDEQLVEREARALFDGTKVRGVNVNRNYRKDGAVIWCEWYSSAIHDEDGKLVSVLSLVLDVTERKNAEQAARRELENTRVLLDAAGALASGRSLGEVLEALCDALLVTLTHRRVIVSLWDETRRSIVTAASKGMDAVPTGEVLAFDEMSEPGRSVLVERRSRIIDYDVVTAGVSPAGKMPAHLALGVPLVYGDRLVGLFTVDDPGERRGFGTREIELAEGIASQASVAIEHARLYDAEHEHARLAEALSRIDLAIHASLDWDEIAGAALAETAEAIGADAALMIGQEGPDLVVWRDFGFAPSIQGMRFKGNAGLNAAAEAVRKLGTIAVDDVQADERFAQTLAPFGERSAIAAPLVVHGETIASLGLSFRRERHHFTDAEIEAVSRVASTLSLALENARIYAAERSLADRLQEAMLTMPERLDGIEFAHAYHSAEEVARVGGDFYDLFEVGHGQVGITIGDVAGKGLEAAVLTTLAKNTIRAHASEVGKSPAEVLALANDVVLKATPTESFVTVFFGLLDRASGGLRYCSAGHTTGAVVHADGTTDELPATSPLLGGLPDVVFQEAEVRLAPEDVLFLYTDGLTEARRDGGRYGEERVFEVLATDGRTPFEICRRVTDDVLEYAGHRLDDDLALLALRLLGREQETPPAAGLQV